jgi:hypothetical protein
MNFLGCDGLWQLHADGSTVCEGQLKTFTVQEMRDSLTPSITMIQKAEITTGLLGLFVLVYVLKTLRTIP